MSDPPAKMMVGGNHTGAAPKTHKA